MDTKTCNKCKRELPVTDYQKHPNTADRRQNQCRDCRRVHRNEYIDRVGYGSFHKYEKTKKGFLMRAYRNMKSRITGVQSKKQHLYAGLELLDKELFYQWALADQDFNMLFANWEANEYVLKLTPSIDRKDSKIGYAISNMRWLTQQENSRLGAVSRYNQPAPVLKYNINSKEK
jgi:hypothetical protein